MTPRLLPAVLALILPLGACDDPVDPAPAAVADLEVTVSAPEFVQAGDSFDVQVVVGNETANPSASLALDFCYRWPSDGCVFTEIGAAGVVAAGGEETIVFRTALSPQAVVLGGSGDVEVCIRDSQGDTNCSTAPVRAGPDLEALCDPAIVTLPLTASTAAYGCSEEHPLLIVIGIEADANRAYIFDVEGVPYFGFSVYHPDGVENMEVGSRPDGKWFVSQAAGRLYLVVDAPNHFTFAASDGGPWSASRIDG